MVIHTSCHFISGPPRPKIPINEKGCNIPFLFIKNRHIWRIRKYKKAKTRYLGIFKPFLERLDKRWSKCPRKHYIYAIKAVVRALLERSIVASTRVSIIGTIGNAKIGSMWSSIRPRSGR